MNDGRTIVGYLRGYDQVTNIVLEDSFERIYLPDAPVEFVPRGLYVIRGDNVAAIGEIDPDLDLEIDFQNVRGEFILPITHS